jgi:hypothetical protein
MKHPWSAAAILMATGLLGACSPGQTASIAGNEEKPAQVVQIEGSDISQVILTPQATKRLGIKTQPVAQVGAAVQNTEIPAASLVYGTDGRTWIYTTADSLTYVRQAVVVARIEGDKAILQTGPDPGTLVVTVGAAELLGTEYGVEGE